MTVQLYLGDCIEFMCTLPDGSVDAVITDQPYGIDFKYNNHNDNPENYPKLMRAVVAECQRLVGKGPCAFWQAMKNAPVWHNWFPTEFRLFAACKGFVQYRPTAVQYSFDPIVFWGNIRNKPSVYSKDYHIQSLAPFGTGRTKIDHPCPRPYEQTIYVVQLFTQSGDIVFDPFMGSGTTGVACVKTGRNFIGCEIDPTYFAIAEKRIAQAQLQIPLPEFS